MGRRAWRAQRPPPKEHRDNFPLCRCKCSSFFCYSCCSCFFCCVCCSRCSFVFAALDVCDAGAVLHVVVADLVIKQNKQEASIAEDKQATKVEQMQGTCIEQKAEKQKKAETQTRK